MRSIHPIATLDQLSPDKWRRVMAVKLDVHVLGARAIVSLMRKAGFGSIVAIRSGVALKSLQNGQDRLSLRLVTRI